MFNLKFSGQYEYLFYKSYDVIRCFFSEIFCIHEFGITYNKVKNT